jgi:hypothetical protein
MNEKYAMAYMNNEWKILDRDILIDKIYNDKKNYVEQNLEEFVSVLSKIKMEALKRWIDDSNDSYYEDEYQEGIKIFKEEIKQLLYNNRQMAMIRKKESEKINKKDKMQIKEIDSIVLKKDEYDSDYVSNYSYDKNYKSSSDNDSDSDNDN